MALNIRQKSKLLYEEVFESAKKNELMEEDKQREKHQMYSSTYNNHERTFPKIITLSRFECGYESEKRKIN